MPNFNLGLAVRHPLKAIKYYEAYKNREHKLLQLLQVDMPEIRKYIMEFESKNELFGIIKNAAEKYKLGDISGTATLIFEIMKDG